MTVADNNLQSASTNAMDCASVPQRQHRRRWIPVCAAVAAAIVSVCFYLRPGDPPVVPPEVDLSNAGVRVRSRIELARNAVLKSPESADAWGRLGLLLLAHQFDADSVTCLRQAARLKPDEFRWSYCLGLAATSLDRPLAIAAFQQACDIRPRDWLAHARQGELLLTDGDLAGAGTHLLLAVQNMAVPDPRPLQALARVRLLENKASEARDFAERAYALAPRSRMVSQVLAQAIDRTGEKEAARGILRRFQQLPDEPLPWNDPLAAEALAFRADESMAVESAMDFAQQGDFGRALQSLTQELQRDPKNIRVILALAQVYMRVNQPRDALRLLNATEIRNAGNAEVAFRTGVAYFMLSEFEQAAAAFQKAIAIKPDYVMAHYNLGHCFLQLGNMDQAKATFERTLQIAPEHLESRINLARMLIRANEMEAAKEQLRRVIEQSPANAEAIDLQKQLGDR